FEAQLQTAYTAQTLAFLTRRHPTASFIWLMGADNLAEFHRWQEWRSIAHRVPIAIVDRPHWRMRAMASPAAHYLAQHRVPERSAAALANQDLPAWTVLTNQLSELSSSDVRAGRRLKVDI
ncbi:MAG: nicotinic acid mononucleotide adenylyltransferase, partial [Pseudomonadota bacterium]